MPAYNFQQRFAPLVESGQKKQTIRARRRDGRAPKVGQLFAGYTGMRTKKCRKLVTSSITEVQPIEIRDRAVHIGNTWLGPTAAITLAIADGFTSIDEMFDWFLEHHGERFRGHLIRWR